MGGNWRCQRSQNFRMMIAVCPGKYQSTQSRFRSIQLSLVRWLSWKDPWYRRTRKWSKRSFLRMSNGMGCCGRSPTSCFSPWAMISWKSGEFWKCHQCKPYKTPCIEIKKLASSKYQMGCFAKTGGGYNCSKVGVMASSSIEVGGMNSNVWVKGMGNILR